MGDAVQCGEREEESREVKNDDPSKLEVFREIGWKYWVPLDLKQLLNSDLVVPPVDEYDRYLVHVAGMLSTGSSQGDAAEYSRSVFLDPDDPDPESCRITATKIVEYVKTLD